MLAAAGGGSRRDGGCQRAFYRFPRGDAAAPIHVGTVRLASLEFTSRSPPRGTYERIFMSMMSWTQSEAMLDAYRAAIPDARMKGDTVIALPPSHRSTVPLCGSSVCTGRMEG